MPASGTRFEPAGTTDVIVVGAGHAGLSASHCLARQGINHVVLERGEVANSWRHERWDSLKLLTQNWQCRLPDFRYRGDDPEGFMGMGEVIDFLAAYASFSGAPIRAHTEVRSVREASGGFEVITNRGRWLARAVILASGACNLPKVPAVARQLPGDIRSLTPHEYRNPSQIEPGSVLVVGASASGLQLADELQRAGHAVTLAAGEHVRMPRRYRGHDIQHWLDRTGVLEETWRQVDDVTRARHLPSPQLIGSHEHDIFDLNHLTRNGVRLVGKLMALRDGEALLSGALANTCKLADLKMNRLLDEIDGWADHHRFNDSAPHRFAATQLPEHPTLRLDLKREGIRTVIWATGFLPDFGWLDVPVLDHRGRLQHDGGVTPSPGLYVLGLPMLRKRKSSFIHGAEDDARAITWHVAEHLRGNPSRPRAAEGAAGAEERFVTA